MSGVQFLAVVKPAGLGLAEAEICLSWDARHSISVAPFRPKSHFGRQAGVGLGHVVGHRLLNSSKPGLLLFL